MQSVRGKYKPGYIGPYDQTQSVFTAYNMREAWEAARYHYTSNQPLNFGEFMAAAFPGVNISATKPLFIKIMRCGNKLSWYSDRIGEVFEVIKSTNHEYYVRVDEDPNRTHWVSIGDAELMERLADVESPVTQYIQDKEKS